MKYLEVIRLVMAERGLTQQAFAESIGVNQTTVCQWLLGNKKPSYDNIVSICKMYDILPNELFDFDESDI